MEFRLEWLTFIIFTFICLLSVAIAYQAHRGGKKSGYDSMARYTEYVQFMQDKHQLNRLGIAQQLKRSIRGFAAFGISFNTMPLLGAFPLIGYALHEGGAAVISIGWPLLSIFGLLVGAVLAEMLSTAPTAGGLYHVSALLGGKRAAWYTGWLQLLGQTAFLMLSNMLAAALLSEVLCKLPGFPSQGMLFVLSAAGITLLQLLIGSRGSGILAVFQTGLTVTHLALIVLFIGSFTALLWSSASFSNIYTLHSSMGGGWNDYVGLFVGIMILQRMFLGAEMVSGSGEEIVEPRLTVPWSLYLSTAYMVIFGFVSLLLMAAVTMNSSLMETASTIPVVKGITAQFPWSAIWGQLLNFGVIAVLISSGMGSMTAASRTLYAMARERGLPFSRLWTTISKSGRVPLPALIVIGLSALVLTTAITVFATSAETGVRMLLAAGIVLLQLSYVIPIIIRCTAQGRAKLAELNPSWALGRLSLLAGRTSIVWLLLTLGAALVLDPLAAAICGAAIALIATGDAVYARKRYEGMDKGISRSQKELLVLERKFRQ